MKRAMEEGGCNRVSDSSHKNVDFYDRPEAQYKYWFRHVVLMAVDPSRQDKKIDKRTLRRKLMAVVKMVPNLLHAKTNMK